MRPTVSPIVLLAGVLLGSCMAAAADIDALTSLPRHVAIDSRLHVSGQPSAEALTKLGSAGVRTVIDLRPDAETPDLDERAVVEKSGLVYRSLPVAGKEGLTRENVTAFDRLLADAGEGKVLVHCASGNRVGAMMALRALWLQGKSTEESIAIGTAAGMTGLATEVKALLEAEAGRQAPAPK